MMLNRTGRKFRSWFVSGPSSKHAQRSVDPCISCIKSNTNCAIEPSYKCCPISSSTTWHNPQGSLTVQQAMDSTHSARPRHPTFFKSRNGCYGCKARKTKCCETKPTCTSCLERRDYCKYPRRPQVFAPTSVSAPQPLLPTFPPAAVSQAQYFNHYLSETYPFMPAGNEDIWKTYIPQYAFHNEYLMAAVLGLSAAHFHSIYGLHHHLAAASTYRALALAGLKNIMSKNEWDHKDVDGALAISYLLGFQSRLMMDGLFDFFTMLRGTALLSEHVITKTGGGSFRLTRQASSLSVTESAQLDLPTLDPHLIQKGLKSLQSLKSILATAKQLEFFNALHGVLEACLICTAQGLVGYHKLMDDAVSTFFGGNDDITRLLQSYLVSLKLIFEPAVQQFYNSERRNDRVEREVRRVTIKWGEDIFQDLPAHLSRYAEWPRAVVTSREIY